MASVPVSSETVEVMLLVEVLIVARTSPGKLQAVEDGEDLVAVRRQADRLDQRRCRWGLVVAMVVSSVWLLKLTTEIPPPLPALAT